MSQASPLSSDRMQCMEVSGGNQHADRMVVTTGLDVWVRSVPYAGSKQGGDVYYLSSCASGRITRFMVADVSGHGDEVAGVARGLRELMRRNINYIDQRRFVRAMNQQFGGVSQTGGFATAVVGSYFQPRKTLRITVAGHPDPIFYSARTNCWKAFSPEQQPASDHDLPLGVIDEMNYHQLELDLKPDDMVFCYTDSLTESCFENGEMIGTRGLVQILNQISPNPDGFIDRLLKHIASLAPDNLKTDDVTAMLCRPNDQVVSWKENIFALARLLRFSNRTRDS